MLGSRSPSQIAWSLGRDEDRAHALLADLQEAGLQGIADRLAALGGEFVLRTAPGRGTTIRGTVPVGVDP